MVTGFEMQGTPDLSGFPVVVAANTAAAIRQEISTRTGLSAAQVLLRTRGFLVGHGSWNLGPAGYVAGGTGYMLRGDVEGESAPVRIRVCGFAQNGAPALKADVSLQNDQTLLVPITMNGVSTILALHLDWMTRQAWQANYGAIQDSFIADFNAHLSAPEFDVSIGQATSACQ